MLCDPAYCGCFGLAPDEQLLMPYAIPEAWRTAWQHVDLNEGKTAEMATGECLTITPVRQREGLWIH